MIVMFAALCSQNGPAQHARIVLEPLLDPPRQALARPASIGYDAAVLDPVVIGMFFALLLVGYMVRSKGQAPRE